MKNLFLGVAITIFLLSANSIGQTNQTDNEKKIISLMMGFGQAWENGDMSKLSEKLTEDCVHIDPFGKQISGRENIKKHLQWVIDNFFAKTKPTVEISDYTVRFIGSEAAILTYLRHEKLGSARETVVVAKVKSDWKIASFQHIMVSEQPKPESK